MNHWRDHRIRLSDFPLEGDLGRVALVVGNAEYSHTASLRNPTNDAEDMAAVLSTLGFKVTLSTNLGAREFKIRIEEFLELCEDARIRLFYYAGHGIQHQGRNYLIPVDANLIRPDQLDYDSVDVGRILDPLQGMRPAVNILILDACRDEPFSRNWKRGVCTASGLAAMTAPAGSLVCFATSPGDIAADGQDRNGAYTAALLRHINTPNADLQTILRHVRQDVMERTGTQQVPWDSSSLTGELILNDTSRLSPLRFITQPGLRQEIEYASCMDEQLEVFRKSTVSMNDRSTEGAGVDVYWKGESPTKAVYVECWESGRLEEIFYFRDGACVLACTYLYRYNRPIMITKEVARAIGDTEWFDESKTQTDSLTRWPGVDKKLLLRGEVFDTDSQEASKAFDARLGEIVEILKKGPAI